MSVCKLLMIGAEGGSRTRTPFRTTDFKSGLGVLASFYYALLNRIYLRFSRQSSLRLPWKKSESSRLNRQDSQVATSDSAFP